MHSQRSSTYRYYYNRPSSNVNAIEIASTNRKSKASHVIRWMRRVSLSSLRSSLQVTIHVSKSFLPVNTRTELCATMLKKPLHWSLAYNDVTKTEYLQNPQSFPCSWRLFCARDFISTRLNYTNPTRIAKLPTINKKASFLVTHDMRLRRESEFILEHNAHFSDKDHKHLGDPIELASVHMDTSSSQMLTWFCTSTTPGAFLHTRTWIWIVLWGCHVEGWAGY
jgi:hypothetical protein